MNQQDGRNECQQDGRDWDQEDGAEIRTSRMTVMEASRLSATEASKMTLMPESFFLFFTLTNIVVPNIESSCAAIVNLIVVIIN